VGETTQKPWWRWIAGGPLLSPWGLAVRAAWIVVLFAVLHGLGWRDFTSILSGTAPGESLYGVKTWLGVLYALAYFAAVIVAPILVIAGALLGVFDRYARGASSRCST
jgi:hypothetical protein